LCFLAIILGLLLSSSSISSGKIFFTNLSDLLRSS
jgi:hypothetical protein